MKIISIKSMSPEKTIPLLETAVEREKNIIMDSLKTTREKVDALAKALAVDIDKLMKGEVPHTEANDMKLIELEGEVEILKHLESELKELESLKICE